MNDALFDLPSAWRVEAARRLGLRGEELIAGLVTGAGYPDALVPAASALRGVVAPVVDLGAGLGAATVWLGDQAEITIVGIEPEWRAARLASQVFAGLRITVGTVAATPLRVGSCGGAALLGVVSLLDQLGPTFKELSRLVQPGGMVVVSDLFATRRLLRHPDGSPNVFRTVAGFVDELRAAAFASTVVWRAPATRPTAWDDAGRRVDEDIERSHGQSDMFRQWKTDRQRLGRLIDGGQLEVATVALLVPD